MEAKRGIKTCREWDGRRKQLYWVKEEGVISMFANLPKKVQEEVVFHLRNNDFPTAKALYDGQIVKTENLEQKVLVHLNLEEEDVNPSHDAVSLKQKSNAKKESFKMIIMEFILLPISLISSGCVNGAIHLLHCHHIFVLSYLMSHLVSWLSSSITKNMIVRSVSSASTGSMMGNFLRQYILVK